MSSAIDACSIVTCNKAGDWVDRRVAELGEVHLAEALQALELFGVVRMFSDESCLFEIVFQVDLGVSHQSGVQRWLGDVHMAASMSAFIWRMKKSAAKSEVRAVNIRVGKQDHLW